MDLITHIPGIANSGQFTPGPNTPSPWNVPIVGAVDGNGPANATRNMAEIYNRLLFANAALVEASGLPIDNADWAQLVHAFRTNGLIYAAGAGAANVQTVAYTPAIKALVDGMVLWFKAGATNTGATTLNVNGLGAKAVVGGALAPLQGGEIVVNGKCLVVWHAALDSFVLIECTGAALQVAAATKSQHALQLAQLIGSVASASSGYFKIPFIDVGGTKRDLLVQYGTQPGTVASGTVVTFPVAYPNANLGVFGNVLMNNATLTFVLTPTVLTLSGFILNKNYVGATQFGNSADAANWFSIGY